MLNYAERNINLGYSLITEPPKLAESSVSLATLDQKKFGAQYGMAAVAGVVLMWILKNRKKQTHEKMDQHWRII